MRFVVHKYPIQDPRLGPTVIKLPAGSKLLTAGLQNVHIMVVWAQIPYPADVEGEGWAMVDHTIRVVNTGQAFAGDPGCSYLATITHPETGVVWHVFEVQP